MKGVGSGFWLHVIDGPEKALLIDTGGGIGDLKGLIRHLIGDKPLYVANTHEHWDHVLGNYQFDEVYCHTLAVPYITKHFMTPDVWAPYCDENGKGRFREFDRKDLIEYKPYALFPVEDGHIFDLGGGHTIQVIYTPGHASGGISFLYEKGRIFFTGGMHSASTVITGISEWYPDMSTVDSLMDALVRVEKEFYDKFDTIFAGHEIIPMDKSYLLDELQACRDVVADHSLCKEEIKLGADMVLHHYTTGSAGLRYAPTAFRK